MMPPRRTVTSVLISMTLVSCSAPSGDGESPPSHCSHTQGETQAVQANLARPL